MADVILDRIIHDSYKALLDGEISMRERRGLGRSNGFRRSGKANGFILFSPLLSFFSDGALLRLYYLGDEQPSIDDVVQLAIQYMGEILKE
ncbi:hypothetical protein [Tetragenococcus halophilus]|uniref:hypothetical protein n=1 Tax=Tetragenococcus halophilus TaxID=51669 RepID=UPI002402DC84|nr:hypothetical protein [Tetragenococcus halophilus]GLL52308.1 hypothetical protein YA5_022870 [Tetragenococcus halophilus]